jgi:aspartyl-tRNA synthetase
MQTKYRTHTCGELNAENLGDNATISGWVKSSRDHGGLVFIDLRDRYGITQIVFEPTNDKEVHKLADTLRREDVIQVSGKVRNRPEGMVNSKIPTGQIEILVSSLIILNKSETPPLEIDDNKDYGEDVRLKYRYLDLRTPSMQNNLLLRHKVVKAVRDYFDKNNFLEIETPILAKSTPEGARDYLVPSRTNAGEFYALPQSPQLFKQLLMLAGFDRYVQIAKCFRDEDLRADRQPEFSQIDVEMSFVGEEDIYAMGEALMKDIFKVIGKDIKTPFKRLTYKAATEKYGLDKPDTRFGLELIDVSEIVNRSDFSVFKQAVQSGGKVKCINAKKCASFSRKDIDALTEHVATYGAKGLAWMKMQDKLESSVVKFFSEDIQKELINSTHAEEGDLLLFVADHKHFVVNTALGQLRIHLAERLKLIPEDSYDLLWVTDFPLVDYDEDEQRHVAVHHPFTAPKDEFMDTFEQHGKEALSKAYDLVLNGSEIGGGSIRIHDPNVQSRMFKMLGIGDEEANRKFGFLLNAFKYGAPPHGGMALGLDRICAILTGNTSIREVIAFPKNKNARSLMEDAPSSVSEKQLNELHIISDVVKKETKTQD